MKWKKNVFFCGQIGQMENVTYTKVFFLLLKEVFFAIVYLSIKDIKDTQNNLEIVKRNCRAFLKLSLWVWWSSWSLINRIYYMYVHIHFFTQIVLGIRVYACVYLRLYSYNSIVISAEGFICRILGNIYISPCGIYKWSTKMFAMEWMTIGTMRY